MRTTVAAAQSQQQDQATLERSQTMAVSTHNAVAVGEAAGQWLDVTVQICNRGRLRHAMLVARGQAPVTLNAGDRVAVVHDRTRRLHVHSAISGLVVSNTVSQ